VFEVRVQTVFCAAHSLMIGGVREPVHGHNWQVEAAVTGDALDGDGLLVDFHGVEHRLKEITRPWNNGNLNELVPFDRVNPSAENVAKRIGEALAEGLGAVVGTRERARGVQVAWVSVSEAPGCVARYFPGTRGLAGRG
jgi:6-pyruvoyltetrahydropterin/6-carboxytetrahydropterin synthase